MKIGILLERALRDHDRKSSGIGGPGGPEAAESVEEPQRELGLGSNHYLDSLEFLGLLHVEAHSGIARVASPTARVRARALDGLERHKALVEEWQRKTNDGQQFSVEERMVSVLVDAGYDIQEIAGRCPTDSAQRMSIEIAGALRQFEGLKMTLSQTREPERRRVIVRKMAWLLESGLQRVQATY